MTFKLEKSVAEIAKERDIVIEKLVKFSLSGSCFGVAMKS